MLDRARFLHWVKDEERPTYPGDYICWNPDFKARKAVIRANTVSAAAEFYSELMRSEGSSGDPLMAIQVRGNEGQLWSVQITWVPRPRYVATNIRCVELSESVTERLKL